MKWLARLKKIEIAPEQDATEPTKPSSVGFAAPILAPIQKTGGETAAVIADPDRWAWPHSTAMTGAEIDTFTVRLARFTDKGFSLNDGEALADRLVVRDRDGDDRHLCAECAHCCFGMRCAKKLAVLNILQRCDQFTSNTNP